MSWSLTELEDGSTGSRRLLQRLSPLGTHLKSILTWLAPGLAFVALSLMFGETNVMRLMLCFSIGVIVWALLRVSPALGISALAIFFCLLGGIRRWLIPVLGWPSMDPLLLIGPLIAIAFFVNQLIGRQLRADTKMAKLVLVLVAFMVLEVVNPLQGGLSVGIAGGLFYVIPLLWFFLGRSIGNEHVLGVLFRVMIAMAVAACLLGLFQTYGGLSDTDQQWMKLAGFSSLHVGNEVRAISFCTSPQEYDFILCFGIVLSWAMFLNGNRIIVGLIPLLAVGVFLESGRTAVVLTLATMMALWAIMGRDMRSWLPRGALAVGLAAIGLVWSMQQLQSVHMSDKTQALVMHQTAGILNPTDPKDSTAALHGSMITAGIASGFAHPLGLGLGATCLAAEKLGGNASGTEFDISNMFSSLGFIGGFLYVFIIGTVLAAAFRNWHEARSYPAMCIVGVLIAMFGLWLAGEVYSAVFLIWFSIGSLDRIMRDRHRAVSDAGMHALPRQRRTAA